MTMDLQFEDGTKLRLREPQQHPLALLMAGVGVHHFKLRQEVESVALADGCNQVHLSGELWSENDGRSPRWLGSFTPTTTGLQLEVPRSVDLSLPLTTDQVLALERDRNGGELQLMVDFRASLPQSRKYALMDGQAHFRVPASEWQRRIEDANRGTFFTVTVPLPLDDGPLATAAAHLLNAKRQITAGQYPDAIRETRLAIEVMRDMKLWPKDVTKKLKDQEQADRYGLMLDHLDDAAEGYQKLLQASFNQASGVQHSNGVIARATWVRADAVTLTGMAASLMHRIAEEITEVPHT
jgi:hypothetical protein